MATALLIAVWAGAAAGIVVELIWIDAPKWVSVVVYLAVGWIGALAFPAIVAEAGIGAGVADRRSAASLYTAGAVVYARQRPDPQPGVFGYHEIFHVLVVAAAGGPLRRDRDLRRSPPAELARTARRGRRVEVGPLARGELGATARVLADAFLDDPVWTAIGPRQRLPPRGSPTGSPSPASSPARRATAAGSGLPASGGAVVGATIAFEPGRWPIPTSSAVWELGWLARRRPAAGRARDPRRPGDARAPRRAPPYVSVVPRRRPGRATAAASAGP